MVRNPEYVAGSERMCTDLMRVARGRIFAKVGAEGVYCAGVPGAELGIALKVEDGSARAVAPAILAILRQLDRVLRSVSTDHSFTSLALIRLDPTTGEAAFANAGYPYPLVLSDGRIHEIELPGFPLGRGPAHPFPEQPFTLPRGGVLLLCSDGLFEGLDRNGNAYGFDRAREVLQAMGRRPALEIVDALLNDSRRHLGTEKPPDDVTIVVVKRG